MTKRRRGIVSPDGYFTDAGRASKDRIEAMTDRLAEAPYAGLGAAAVDELMALLAPITERLNAGLETPG